LGGKGVTRMIIDVHTHIFPDSIAANAVPKLAAEAGIREALDGRLSSLLGSMQTTGIDVSWVQPVATRPQQVDAINQWLEEIRSERLTAFGAFHPGYADLPGLIRNLSQRGFPGIKIHPEYHAITPDDPQLFPMYQAIIGEGRVILFHAGEDIGIPTIHSTPRQFADLNDQWPDLTMILAHMGGFRQWREVRDGLVGRNLFLDTSYVFGHLPDEEFVEMVRKHGCDRILFGTDSPWTDQQQELEHLQQLPFTAEELDQMCGLNAWNLLQRITA